jgi:septal ring factor EnvC (AmiA/AmiB activator)
MSASRSALCCFAAFLAIPAHGGRPPEARDAERRALDLEMDLLHRKVNTLGNAIAQRRQHLARRVRALYKISGGGYLRLLVNSETPAELFERRNGMRRIVRRDLEELSSVRRELSELESERARLRDRERHAAELEAATWDTVPPRLARKSALYRPVPGPVVGAFGKHRDPKTNLLATRDGVELATRPGETVRAVAPGEVRAACEVPGLGLAVIVDHGDGWRSLLGRLKSARVAVGDRVTAGQNLGEAAAATVHLQLTEGGAWLDPSGWLAR